MNTSRAVIVQCRLSSTRLPGKALKKLGNKTVLEYVLSAMKKVNADRYFVATDFDSYEALKPVCESCGYEIFAGDLQNVLKRFCDLIQKLNVDTIIRATADNPFLFYEAAEESCKDFEERNKSGNKTDYLTWTGLPHGSGVEIFSANSLLLAASQTKDPYDEEHVGPSLYRHTDKFNCVFTPAPEKYNHPELRTTIDTYTDYIRASRVVDFLGENNNPYSTETVVNALKNPEISNPVILIPSVVKNHGTGHLRRCLNLALKKTFFVYIPKNKDLLEADSLIEEYKNKGLKDFQIIDSLPDETYKAFVVTDKFKLTEQEVAEYSKQNGLLMLDEGSNYDFAADYILDVIPSINQKNKINYNSSDFIEKPENIKKNRVNVSEIKEILVCLGGEDPAELTGPCVKAVVQCYPEAHITAVGKLVDYKAKNVEVKDNIPALKEKLFNYDLVFTHYGLTAWEARAAGCGVVLLPTSKLHVQLAKKYDFAYIENKKILPEDVKNAIKSNYLIHESSVQENKDLSDFILNLSDGKRLDCPVCGKKDFTKDKVISRNSTRTYRRCCKCSMVYMSWTQQPEKSYEKAYFFEDYKKQYGKTYQEDFQNIKTQGLRRVEEILNICGNKENQTILDIGCAYGPFLSAAQDKKLIPYGTDISEDAVNFVKNDLQIPAVTSAFPEIDTVSAFQKENFDIITMWYVIEHFKNLDQVLQTVSKITRKGGIFAFSTPSGQGISAVSNPDHFYEISPKDHYTIWEPSKAGNILRKYGFKVIKTVSTGHHPERFPEVAAENIKKGSSEWEKIDNISHRKKLGDTCEIYCKKVK